MNDKCKKRGMMFKGWSEEQCRWRIKNHLMTSSYHLLNEQDAELQMCLVNLESWEEEHAEKAEEAVDWGATDEQWSRKRRRGGYAQGSLPSSSECAQVGAMSGAMVRQAFGNPQLHLNLRQRNVMSRVPRAIPADTQVVLNGVQAQIIMDSLSRARAATQACQNVAESSLSAFATENERLTDLQEVLHSWLQEQA